MSSGKLDSAKKIIGFVDSLLTDSKYLPKKEEPPEMFYHYTDVKGLKGLLNKSSIWGTEINFLNDSTEFLHGVSVFEEVAAALGLDAKNESEYKFFDSLLSNDLIQYKNPEELGSYIFTVSFSEKKDDLNQWRSYGANGTGFCIGVNPKDMPQASFYKLEYNSDSQQKRAKELLDLIKDNLFNQLPLFTKGLESGRFFPPILASSIVGTLLIHSLMMKNPVFEEESEWRTILFQNKNFESTLFNFFSTDFGKLVPRVEIPFVNFKNAEFEKMEIWVGPKNNFKNTKLALEFEIKRLGYDLEKFEILKSEVPYR